MYRSRAYPVVALLAVTISATAATTALAAWSGTGLRVSSDQDVRSSAASCSDGLGGQIVVWQDDYRGAIDLYAQRFTSDGTRLWGDAGIPVCRAPGNQYFPDVASDGAGGALVAWEDHRGASADVYVQRLNSTGSPLWTADGVGVCTLAASNQVFPRVIPDGSGGAIAAWADGRAGNFDIYLQRVGSAGTAQWTVDGVALCAATGSQLNPSPVPDGSGGAVVAWEDSRTGTADIYARRITSAGTPQWTADGVALCTASNAQGAPAAVADGASGAIVAWRDLRGGTAYDIYARRVNAGGTPQWTPDGAPICLAANDQNRPAAVADGTGGAIIAWDDGRGGLNLDLYAQRVNGAGAVQWTPDGVAVSLAAGTQTAPVLAADGIGGVLVGWRDNRSGSDYDLYAARLNGSGVPQWTANGVAVCPEPGGPVAPSIVADGTGGAFLAWTDQRNPSDDVYARRVDAGGAPQWSYAGITVCVPQVDQVLPAAIADGAGGAFVAWEERHRGDGDIFAQHVSAAGALLWAAAEVPVCTVSGQQAQPAIVSDGAGGVIIAWTDYRGNQNGDLYAQRLDASGTPQWLETGKLICNAANTQTNVKMVPDGSGGAVMVWEDYRSGGSYDIYSQRVNASGTPQWTANGVALCTAAGDQDELVIVSDGAAGAIAAWTDYRGGSASDLYVRRVSGVGAPQWTANGVAMCTAPGDQRYPAITTDGAGGAIVAWQDGRGPTPTDLYARRITSAGALQWTANGETVCDATGGQTVADIAADGAGGAFIVWTDGRTTPLAPDIYAQRISGAGVAQWAACGVALCTAPYSQYGPKLAPDGSGGIQASWYDGRLTGDNTSDLYGRRVSGAGVPQGSADGYPISAAPNGQSFATLVAGMSGGVIAVWQDERNSAYGGLFDVYAQLVQATGAVAVEDPPAAGGIELAAWPNPTSAGAVIRFELSRPALVSLAIYDLAGRLVRDLVEAPLAGGPHAVAWDGRDESGRAAPSAVYYCRLEAEGAVGTLRLVETR